MIRFHEVFAITPRTRVLDAGGTSLNWLVAPLRPRLVMLNLPGTREETDVGAELVFGDARAMPFRDGAFDVVFSNSVIEHLRDESGQRSFAEEVRRVGRAYWVQTPNRWFPIELHLLTPFLHWLPRRWQAAVARRFTVWEWLARPSAGVREYYISHYLNDVRLLQAAAVRRLFPEASLLRERFFGITKSLIAYRKPGLRSEVGSPE